MLSAFQIFKMLLGVVIFIFILFFFLRISDMYAGVKESSQDYDIMNGFDKAVRQTYTSGNPGYYDNFRLLDSLFYDPPRLKSVNQKTLSVTTFLIPSTFETNLVSECDDYGWFRFCWVYAYPKNFTLLFTPIENTPETRALIESIVEVMPDYAGDIEFAYCNESDTEKGDKDDFLGYVSTEMAVSTYNQCELEIPDGYRLVTITQDDTLEPGRNEIILSPQTPSTGTFKEHLSGLPELTDTNIIRTGGYSGAGDLYFLLTTGKSALDYKNDIFISELKLAAGIMEERMRLIRKNMRELNVQPCAECPTPFPMDCGYTDYKGEKFNSDLYDGIVDSLSRLNLKIQNDQDYATELAETAEDYEALKIGGCE